MPPTHADPDHAGALHHVELAVADFDTAEPFWDWLLADLGYEPKDDWEGGRSWILGPTYLVVKRAEGERAHEREQPGLDHLAFHAASRAQVDRISDAVRECEATRLLYPDQHPYAGGYYAAYVRAPSSITVEVVGPEA
mgnify:CR=1 FL=1